MDYKDRILRVEDVNDLQVSPTTAAAEYQQLVVADLLRVRWPNATNSHFRFFGIHTVFGNMLLIPFVPAKLHPQLLAILPAHTPGQKLSRMDRSGTHGFFRSLSSSSANSFWKSLRERTAASFGWQQLAGGVRIALLDGRQDLSDIAHEGKCKSKQRRLNSATTPGSATVIFPAPDR